MSNLAADIFPRLIQTFINHRHCSHGRASTLFHRAELIQALYEGLPDNAKERVLTGKKVVDVASDEDGVSVTCADGIKYEGSILLGADGVHSVTRRLLRNLALNAGSKAIWDSEVPYTSTFKGMWCSFPRPSEPGKAFEAQHKDRSLVYFTSRDRGYIFMFEKLECPTKEHIRYADEDVSEFGHRFAEYPINETLKVKDVFSKRLAVGMANLEEGLVKQWNWGRVVLMGDACHKFTPYAGLGLNNGIQDVVALCNGLQKAITESQTDHVGITTLTELFQKYQTDRLKALRAHVFVSTLLPRANSGANILYFVLARYILPLKCFEYIILNYVVSRFIRRGLVLEYVSVEEPFETQVQWVHSVKYH